MLMNPSLNNPSLAKIWKFILDIKNTKAYEEIMKIDIENINTIEKRNKVHIKNRGQSTKLYNQILKGNRHLSGWSYKTM